MIWALVENEKIQARPNTEGICPFCRGKVFSKCGQINIWHWAHSKDENCDTWYEPESEWHFNWKMSFGKENTEVKMEKDGKMHIADILTNENVVIELQNSPILNPIIREREEFYGERMLWLINGEKFKKNLIIKDSWEDEDSRILKSLPRPPSRYIRLNPEVKKGENGEFYKWIYPRKSWKDSQRPLFIDFGENTLFWVHEGMGTTQIRGTYISKEKFLKKYGGNHEFYSQQTK
jgi:competence protein CoiA